MDLLGAFDLFRIQSPGFQTSDDHQKKGLVQTNPLQSRVGGNVRGVPEVSAGKQPAEEQLPALNPQKLRFSGQCVVPGLKIAQFRADAGQFSLQLLWGLFHGATSFPNDMHTGIL